MHGLLVTNLERGSPHEMEPEQPLKVSTEPMISRGESARLRMWRSVVRGKPISPPGLNI